MLQIIGSLVYLVQNLKHFVWQIIAYNLDDSLPWSIEAGGVKLTIHLHIVPRLRMGGAIPPLPHLN